MIEENVIEKLGKGRLSNGELVEKIAEVYQKNDYDSIKEMFRAYRNFEIRERKKSTTTIRRAIIRAQEDFDWFAAVAGEFLKVKNIYRALYNINKNPFKTNPVNLFYRKATEYEPLIYIENEEIKFFVQ